MAQLVEHLFHAAIHVAQLPLTIGKWKTQLDQRVELATFVALQIQGNTSSQRPLDIVTQVVGQVVRIVFARCLALDATQIGQRTNCQPGARATVILATRSRNSIDSRRWRGTLMGVLGPDLRRS